MPGINSILDIGRGALFASQTALEVTGNNIANVSTAGYSRRTVRLQENMSIDTRPGQLGTGVTAMEVVRHFDQFIENTYNDRSAEYNRWNTLYENMRSINSLFNESNSSGISSSLASFFDDWQTLTTKPNDRATREELLSDSVKLVDMIRNAEQQLVGFQQQTNNFIQQEVSQVNQITKRIAELNHQINTHEVAGQNNANELRDERAKYIRDLSEKMDVKVIDKGGGNMSIMTHAGHTLVEGNQTFEIAFEDPQAYEALTATSNFDGDIYFEGTDEFEYTFEVVSGGDVSAGGTAATMRVSLDGGKTWLKDDDGNELHVSARPDDNKVSVRNLNIWFGNKDDSATTPATNLQAGDKFTVVPKRGIYWYQDTSTKENITPQALLNGTDDNRRLTGGSLTGYFDYRDNQIGKFRDKLNSFSRSLVWEVNRQHTIGAGLKKFDGVTGTYQVELDNVALADDTSGLSYRNNLASGSAVIYVYDEATGDLLSSASVDFGAGAGLQNFDPNQHSLASCAAAINRSFGGSISATIVNHRLQLTAEDGKQVAFGADSTGLWAALGVNTFFEGDSASTIGVNTVVSSDLDYLSAGHVNGAGEVNTGDNTASVAIAALQDTDIKITTVHNGTTEQNLSDFYNSLVADVGANTSTAEFGAKHLNALKNDLDARQKEISGVSLDEEMSNLIKFQHSYSASAKLISTADQMLQTLLSLKQ